MRINDSDLDFDMGLKCRYQGHPFTGTAVEHYPGGELRSELTYVEGVQQGVARDWYPTGELAGESLYSANQRHGLTREWFEDGQPKSELYYEFGIPISKKEWDRDGELGSTWELKESDPRYQILEQARRQFAKAVQL